MTTQELQLAELGQAARRAGAMMAEHVNEMVDVAERQANGIRIEAEREAETVRREALESSRRVLERISALERPLGEVVMTLRHEMERVSGELGNGHQLDLPAGAITDDGPNGNTAPSETEPTSEASVEDQREPEPEESATATTPPPPASGRRGLFKRRRGSRVFVDVAGECAVCQCSFMAGSKEKLAASGWRVSGDVGLCPDCVADGWQLPEGARLPFRRGAS